MSVRKAVDARKDDAETLVIKWFGTASYEIRLGGRAILTDPFVTYKSLGDVLAVSRQRDHMWSKPELVEETFGRIEPPPAAIFIGHSHYDHMMDTVAALRLSRAWRNIPVYGSETTRNILHGYTKCETAKDCDSSSCFMSNSSDNRWSRNWCESEIRDDWQKIEPLDKKDQALLYKSFEATHAPHFFGIALWDDEEIMELDSPPKIAADFQVGKTYIHFFKFESANSVSFTVGLVGAATVLPKRLEHGGLQSPLDILILCVPGWDKIEDKYPYPKNLLRVLKPRVIILSHYDNFFEPDRKVDSIKLVPTADFDGFLDHLKQYIRELEQSPERYRDFQGVLIPGVGVSMYFKKRDNHQLKILDTSVRCSKMRGGIFCPPNWAH